MTAIETTARNAGMGDIKRILEDQRARRLDLVTTAPAFSATENGLLSVSPGEAVADRQGVADASGLYRPTKVFDEGLAERLGIPGKWLSWTRENRPDIYASTVNAMLHGGGDLILPDQADTDREPELQYPGNGGKHLLRLLRGDPGEEGVARAMLSKNYRINDSLDFLVAIVQGIGQAGVTVRPTYCDLSERRMYVRFACPELWAASPHWLQGYRPPFGEGGSRQRAGGPQRIEPASDLWDGAHSWAETRGLEVGTVVGLGLVASNSDVGNGARFLAPQIRVVACRNGQTITKDADRRVHLGSEMQEGVVAWSADTLDAELDLVAGQTKDAVSGWLTQEYLDEEVAAVEAIAGHPIRNPETAVREIVTSARFTQEAADDILGLMIEGGQGATAGALASAATAYAQTVDSPELAFELENSAFSLMEKAAARR